MSINMYLGEVDHQTDSISKICDEYIKKMEGIKNEVSQFTSQGALKGKAYDSAKSYFSSVYIPLANGMIMVSEAIKKANRSFPDGFRTEVDTNDVVEDILLDQIRRLTEMIAALEAIEESTPGIQAMIMSMRALLIQLKDKLERLYAFDPKSLSYFEDALALLENIKSGLEAITSDSGWNAKSQTFSIDSINMDWARNIHSKWEAREEKLEMKAISYMKQLESKVPQITESEVRKLFKLTKEVPYVEIPEGLKDFLIEEGRGLLDNVISGAKSSGVSTVLESSGNQVKNISQLIMYYSGTWGPDGPNSFVMVSPETAKRTAQAVKTGSFLASAGKYGVPVVGGIIDYNTQINNGESAGDAAIKSGAHVAIGFAGGKAGAAAGAAIGSIAPGPGTVVGAAAGFVIGVGVTAFGNYVFDKIYDNRVAIYNGAKDMAKAAGEKISEVGEDVKESIKKVGSDIGEGVKKVGSDIEDGVKKISSDIEDGVKKVGSDVEKGAKKVGNAVKGFVSGLGSVFG